LKIALRSLFRTRLYSLINVLGLTLGIACSSLLAIYVMDELRYDTMHEASDRMYRVILTDDSDAEGRRYYGMTPPPFGTEMVNTFPEVQDVVRLWQPVGHLSILKEGVRYSERNWYMTESNFFKYFDFEFIAGDSETALSKSNSIVLSETGAKKFFGNLDPLGQTLTDIRFGDLLVTGVIKDIPQRSHLKFDILVSPSLNDDNWQDYMNRFDRFGTYTYIILNEQADLVKIKAMLDKFVASNMGDIIPGIGAYLQPLREIHFNSSQVEFGTDEQKGDFKYVLIFIMIGIFIISIASINYVNLATAKSIQRAKEIGIRKTSGAKRSQLVIQFLSESTLITLCSLVFAVGLVDLLIPYFNEITGRNYDFNVNTMPGFIGIMVSISIVVGLVSGIYPAIYLSKLKPTLILNRMLDKGKSGIILRKTLVITQFTLSIFMIIATVTVYQQLGYMNNYDLGFNKDHLVVIDINNGNVRRDFQAMKSEILKHPHA